MIEPTTLKVGDRLRVYGHEAEVDKVYADRMLIVVRLGVAYGKPVLQEISYETCSLSTHVEPGSPVTTDEEVHARARERSLNS